MFPPIRGGHGEQVKVKEQGEFWHYNLLVHKFLKNLNFSSEPCRSIANETAKMESWLNMHEKTSSVQAPEIAVM